MTILGINIRSDAEMIIFTAICLGFIEVGLRILWKSPNAFQGICGAVLAISDSIALMVGWRRRR